MAQGAGHGSGKRSGSRTGSAATPASGAGARESREPRERRSLLGQLSAKVRQTTAGEGSVSLIALEGRITFGDGDELLKQLVDQLIESGSLHVVIDTSTIDYMDSSGVDAIVRSYNKLAERGGRLRVVVGTERIRSLFEITKLHTVIETFSTAEEALRGFSSAPIGASSAEGTPRG